MVAKVSSVLRRRTGGIRKKLWEDKIILKAIYLIFALAALGIIVWQIGFLFGIPNAPKNLDYTIIFTALTAAVVFSGLLIASIVNREKVPTVTSPDGADE